MARNFRERVGIVLRNPRALGEFPKYILHNKIYNRYMERPGPVFNMWLMDSAWRARLIQKGLLPFPVGGKTVLARMVNTRVLYGSQIRGRVDLPKPSHVQVNMNCRVRNLTVRSDARLLIDNGTTVSDLEVGQDTIVSPNGQVKGQRVGRPGVFFTVDFEGAIGYEHGKPCHRIPAFNSRESSTRLISMLEKWEIPASWFVCGHLFLQECNGEHPYAELDWDGVDWFRYDPATNWKENSSWYLPDLVEHLVGEPLFEVGYHSFAHMLHVRMTDESIRKDAEFAKDLRAEWNIPFDSFAFPTNEPSRMELLVRHGFRRFRGLLGASPGAGAVLYPGFSFLNSTGFLSRGTRLATLDRIAKQPYSSLFTHAHDWISKGDFALLETLLKRLHDLRATGLPLLRVRDIPVR